MSWATRPFVLVYNLVQRNTVIVRKTLQIVMLLENIQLWELYSSRISKIQWISAHIEHSVGKARKSCTYLRSQPHQGLYNYIWCACGVVVFALSFTRGVPSELQTTVVIVINILCASIIRHWCLELWQLERDASPFPLYVNFSYLTSTRFISQILCNW